MHREGLVADSDGKAAEGLECGPALLLGGEGNEAILFAEPGGRVHHHVGARGSPGLVELQQVSVVDGGWQACDEQVLERDTACGLCPTRRRGGGGGRGELGRRR